MARGRRCPAALNIVRIVEAMTRWHPCPERTAWRHETVRGGWYTLQRLWRLRRWHWRDRVAVILTAPIRVVGNLVIGPPTPPKPYITRELANRCYAQLGQQSKSADEFLADGGKPGVFSSRKTEP